MFRLKCHSVLLNAKINFIVIENVQYGIMNKLRLPGSNNGVYIKLFIRSLFLCFIICNFCNLKHNLSWNLS